VSQNRYTVRPRADRDLDDQAHHFETVAGGELGHRFLVAAHDTFTLLATQPKHGWHSRLQHPKLKSLRVFRVKDFEKMLILCIPLVNGVEILRVVHGSSNLQSLLNRGAGMKAAPSQMRAT